MGIAIDIKNYIDGQGEYDEEVEVMGWLIEQAELAEKYRTVIKHLENAYQDMLDNTAPGNDEWIGGWAAAIDFIDENIDWEETDEAKTIVEENKELTERAQVLEGTNGLLESDLNWHKQQNKRYREIFKRIVSVKNDKEFNPYAYMMFEIIEWAEKALEESE